MSLFGFGDPVTLTQLKTAPTNDPVARNAALTAVNQMIHGARRSTELLVAAKNAVMDASLHPDVRTQRASALASDAYKQRTSAEIAKYRAMYFLTAEEAGNQVANWQQVAAQAKDKNHYAVAVEKTKFHGKQRDLMLAAADATLKALDHVPPLPLGVGAQRKTDATNVVEQVSKVPRDGWRPKVYSELTGSFFPRDVRRAAGGFNGITGIGYGSHGFGAVSPLGDTNWWNTLAPSFAAGVAATGAAAAKEGQATAGSDPAGGNALQAGGGILSVLSNLIKTNSGTPATGSGPTGTPVPVGLIVAGALGLGVLVVAVKHFSKK